MADSHVGARADTLAIILTWNKRDLVDRTLETLVASGPIEFDVLVVDNASEDDTVEFITKKYPWVAILRNKKNLGGTGGFNSGMREGLRLGYKYLWLMDNDILVLPGAYRALRDTMDSDGRIGLVASHVLYIEEQHRTQEIGSRIDWKTGRLNQCDKDAVDPPPHINEVDFGSASSLFARAAAAREAGIWDPAYFITFDDVEWGARMKRHGWRVVATSEARVCHASYFARRPKQVLVSCYYSVRNALYFFRRNGMFRNNVPLMYGIFRRLLGDAYLFRNTTQSAITRALMLAMKNYFSHTMGKCGEDIALDEGALEESFPRLGRKPRILLMGGVSPALIEGQRAALESQYPGARIDIFIHEHAEELINRNIPGAIIVPFASFTNRMRFLVKSYGKYRAIFATTNIPRFLFEDFAPFSVRLSETNAPASVSRGGLGAVARKITMRGVVAIIAAPIALAAALWPMPPAKYFEFPESPSMPKPRKGSGKRRGPIRMLIAMINLVIALVTTAIVTPFFAAGFAMQKSLARGKR